MVRQAWAAWVVAGITTMALPAIAPAQMLAAQSVAAAPQQVVRFRVALPLRNKQDLDQLLVDLHDEKSPLYRQWLTPDQFRARFGADPDRVARVTQAMQRRGFTVVGTHATGITVQGTTASVQTMLAAPVRAMKAGSGVTRLVAAAPSGLPAELANEGAHVMAFTPLPEHRTHGKRAALPTDALPDNRYGAAGPYWFTDLKQAYDFPSYKVYTGSGRTIAIVISNDFSDADMAMYFGHEKLPVPHFVRVPVFGGAPFDPDLSAETTLDLQQSGGLAPNATIKQYNIPDLSDDSILEAYSEIVESNAADIVSSSFGIFEAAYFASYNDGVDYTFILDDYEAVFAQGNAQGITFVASSGDSGGLPLPPLDYFTKGPGKTYSYLPGVETPAASPHVTAVGGTNLLTSAKAGSPESRYVGENAFGDALLPEDPYGTGNLLKGGYWGSGGGVSAYFDKPAYQRLVKTGASKRTVPDVSLQMGGCPYGTIKTCPADRSATIVALAGQYYEFIGTSVSAPGFAGLLAVEEERLGGVRLGNVNQQIYAQAAAQEARPSLKFFHTGIQGFNGYDYTATTYDRVLGVGTPFTRAFIFAPDVAPAGKPGSSANP